MNKTITKRILILIPFVIAVATITRCWIEITTSNLAAQWQHYSAIVCTVIVLYFCFKSIGHAVIAVGAFLLLGTLNGFSMTSSIETTQIGIAGLKSLPFNGLSLGLLFLYFVLNFVTLVNLNLDRKERKLALKKKDKTEIVS